MNGALGKTSETTPASIGGIVGIANANVKISGTAMKYMVPSLKVVTLYASRSCCLINTSTPPRTVEESEFDEDNPS